MHKSSSSLTLLDNSMQESKRLPKTAPRMIKTPLSQQRLRRQSYASGFAPPLGLGDRSLTSGTIEVKDEE